MLLSVLSCNFLSDLFSDQPNGNICGSSIVGSYSGDGIRVKVIKTFLYLDCDYQFENLRLWTLISSFFLGGDTFSSGSHLLSSIWDMLKAVSRAALAIAPVFIEDGTHLLGNETVCGLTQPIICITLSLDLGDAADTVIR